MFSVYAFILLGQIRGKVTFCYFGHCSLLERNKSHRSYPVVLLSMYGLDRSGREGKRLQLDLDWGVTPQKQKPANHRKISLNMCCPKKQLCCK